MIVVGQELHLQAAQYMLCAKYYLYEHGFRSSVRILAMLATFIGLYTSL